MLTHLAILHLYQTQREKKTILQHQKQKSRSTSMNYLQQCLNEAGLFKPHLFPVHHNVKLALTLRHRGRIVKSPFRIKVFLANWSVTFGNKKARILFWRGCTWAIVSWLRKINISKEYSIKLFNTLFSVVIWIKHINVSLHKSDMKHFKSAPGFKILSAHEVNFDSHDYNRKFKFNTKVSYVNCRHANYY